MCAAHFSEKTPFTVSAAGASRRPLYHAKRARPFYMTTCYILLPNSSAQPRQRLLDALFIVIHRRAGDQQVRAGLYDQGGGAFVDAAVDLDINVQVARVDHLAQASDFRQGFGNELLPAEAGVDRHN